MGVFTIKIPDVGEGVTEAELTEWNVREGDLVREDDIIAAVMTDKATVEIPSSATGKVKWLGCEVGDTLAVGADLIRIETGDDGDSPEHTEAERLAAVEADKEKAEQPPQGSRGVPVSPDHPASGKQETLKPALRKEGEKPLASPSVRKRAKDNGIDLRLVPGSGKAGIITHEDLDAYFESDGQLTAVSGNPPDHFVHEVKITGLRRKIAERMADANRRIPHITIVEEVDVTALEDLREQLNEERSDDKPKLTVLPFLMGALVKALKKQPALNAHFDDENELLRQFGGVHIGIATQTENGLLVPVVRRCETMNLWQTATQMTRVLDLARNGTASREELSGSTITISSLGPLGAIATTPIINSPEVAIVGVNRMATRPMWNGTEFLPRTMMNLSSSFDHRVIDGRDAAVFVKRLKTLLETPAMIFVEA